MNLVIKILRGVAKWMSARTITQFHPAKAETFSHVAVFYRTPWCSSYH